VCTSLLQGPRRKGGFCAPLRRYTPYTNNSQSNYQIRIHRRARARERAVHFSLCSAPPFPPLERLSTRGSCRVHCCTLRRRSARARMNGDLSRRWERALQPAGPSFSRQDADLKGATTEKGAARRVPQDKYLFPRLYHGQVRAMRPMRARDSASATSTRRETGRSEKGSSRGG